MDLMTSMIFSAAFEKRFSAYRFIWALLYPGTNSTVYQKYGQSHKLKTMSQHETDANPSVWWTSSNAKVRKKEEKKDKHKHHEEPKKRNPSKSIHINNFTITSIKWFTECLVSWRLRVRRSIIYGIFSILCFFCFTLMPLRPFFRL